MKEILRALLIALLVNIMAVAFAIGYFLQYSWMMLIPLGVIAICAWAIGKLLKDIEKDTAEP